MVVWSNTNLGVEAAAVRRSEIWVRRAAEETWLHLSVDDAHVRSFRMPNVYADRLAALLGGEGVGKSVENKKLKEHMDRVAGYLEAARDVVLAGRMPDVTSAQTIEVAKLIQREVHRAERKS